MSDTPTELLNTELSRFIDLKNRLISSGRAQEVDAYGIKYIQNHTKNTDIMICGLTHGNEVIGLEIINLLLDHFLNAQVKSDYNWILLLNNLNAYHANSRFTDYDLNRSFAKNSEEKYEFRRAKEIETLILNENPRFILDLHQTVEPTEALFAVLPEREELIRAAYQFCPEIEIVSFPKEGFSNLGRTLTEFAVHQKIPALVYELGHKGFNRKIADYFSRQICGLNLDRIFQAADKNSSITYWHIEDIVPNRDNLKNRADLVSFKSVFYSEILAENTDQSLSYKCPFDGKIIFPRHQNVKSEERALAYIARAKQL